MRIVTNAVGTAVVMACLATGPKMGDWADGFALLWAVLLGFALLLVTGSVYDRGADDRRD